MVYLTPPTTISTRQHHKSVSMFSTLSPEDPQIVFGRNHRKTYSTFMAISPCCLKVPQLQYSLGRANKTKQFDLCSSGTVFVCKKKIALSLPVPRKKQNQSLIDTLQLKCSLRVCNKNYIRQIRTSKTHRQSEKVPKVTVSYRQTVSGTEDRKKKAPIIDIDPWQSNKDRTDLYSYLEAVHI